MNLGSIAALNHRLWAATVMDKLIRVYQRAVLDRSVWVLLAFALLVGGVSLGIPDFELDASAESLVLENDQDMATFRDISERFGGDDFLMVTYTPPEPLFSQPSLDRLRELREALKAVPRVSQINTILDVPLLENPPVPVSEMVDNIKTLEHPDVDFELAEQELANSPLYDNLLLNHDKNTTVIQLVRPFDQQHRELTKAREALWNKAETAGGLSSAEQEELAQLNAEIKARNAENARLLRRDIAQVREILAPYREQAEIHLGGVPMIANDMIVFVENDLATFGAGVFVFLVVTLLIIFRRVRWVLIALGCCSLTVLIMTGVLGIFHWRVTVISSNFVSLLLILTMSMCIHLIVRYREEHANYPQGSQRELLRATVSFMFKPCLFMALTTMVAFNSLIFSGIRPVIDFGWMMATGVMMALAVTFVVFPSVVMLIGRRSEATSSRENSAVTDFFARLTLRHGKAILLANVVLAVLVVLGVLRLEVENSFINYFKPSTEIYQGMVVVDQRLGGTTPLDVILQFPPVEDPAESTDAAVDDEFDMDFGFDEEPEDPAKYWFTPGKVEVVRSVHRYLEAQPEIGKVLSLATMVDLAERLHGEPLGAVELALLYSAIPDDFRSLVLDPYADPASGQLRVNLRIYDSDPDLKRAELLKRIEHDLHAKLGLEKDEYFLAGMMVLYNNMLQSLFKSQILTLGAVFIGIMLMFVVLFRSLSLAVLAIIPNLLSAGVVLGVMGWVSMPLDMMTITIAAITIGIAVDTTIHYIYRFRLEFDKGATYPQAVERSHASIGRAIWYTSLTIIVGFSILGLSNFIPTIVFGLLTGLAMLMALIMVLTLLPQLLITFKPLGAGSGAE